jgi:hypothetical protein
MSQETDTATITGSAGPGNDKAQDLVTVTIDNQPKQIHRGSHTVAELKVLLGVDPSRVLEQVVGGEFKPLSDDQRITIKGGEIFVSHVPHGGSS